MKTHEEYLAQLDAFLDGELDGQEAAEVGLHVAECAQCGAYVRDALAIRAAFPGIEDVSVPADFAESVMASLPEQLDEGGVPDSFVRSVMESIPGGTEATADGGTAAGIESPPVTAEREHPSAAAEQAEYASAAGTEYPAEQTEHSAADSGEDQTAVFARPTAAFYSEGGKKMDDWKEKWKKAALPLAACLGVILIAAGGFALTHRGGAASMDNMVSGAGNTMEEAADSDGAADQGISRGPGAARFSDLMQDAAGEEDEAELQSAEEEAAEKSMPTEAAQEEAPPTPAPTEAPRPSPTSTPVPTPTTPPVEEIAENGANAAESAAVREDTDHSGDSQEQTNDPGSENPWDHVELTLPDDAGYLFSRYTPLEEEAGGALYAFSRDQYAALLDSLDAAGFVSNTSVPAEGGTVYVYVETDDAADWNAGSEETGSEEEGETEPDFDPEEGSEIGGGNAGSSEVEDFLRRDRTAG